MGNNKKTDVERIRLMINDLPIGHIFDANNIAFKLKLTTARCCKELSNIDIVKYHGRKRTGRWERV